MLIRLLFAHHPQLALCAAGAVAAAATATSSTAGGTTKPKTSESKQKLEHATTQGTKKPTPSTTGSTTRQSKALKTPVPGENRGKRTLYDFGNAGYLYPEVASRRAGFVDSYYPQAGYYNGQQAIGKPAGCTSSS